MRALAKAGRAERKMRSVTGLPMIVDFSPQGKAATVPLRTGFLFSNSRLLLQRVQQHVNRQAGG